MNLKDSQFLIVLFDQEIANFISKSLAQNNKSHSTEDSDPVIASTRVRRTPG